ncbi:hypothetical protein [Actinomadura nitritigenes]|uniref:hypothetical protein n=1 Tax=Actinomadura nitritigenes TaxID=134602 RepID=UPI003D8EE9D7
MTSQAAELGEDPLYDRRRALVDDQTLHAFAVGGLGKVGVSAGVRECVSAGRTSAQEPSLAVIAALAERTRVLIRLRSW